MKIREDMIRTTVLGDAVDLDSYVLPGKYTQELDAQAGTGSNYPVSLSGVLLVEVNNLEIYQTYKSSAGISYTRNYSSGWSDWNSSLDATATAVDSTKWDGGDKYISDADASGTAEEGSVWFKY